MLGYSAGETDRREFVERLGRLAKENKTAVETDPVCREAGRRSPADDWRAAWLHPGVEHRVTR